MRKSDGKLHYSELKRIATSPLHYKRALEVDSGDTKSFALGRAVHRAWLCVEQTPVFSGRRDMRNKDYAAAVEQFGEALLNKSEAESVAAMVSALRNSESAIRAKAACDVFEKSIEFTRSGIPCAGRVDGMGSNTLLELKTCASGDMHPKRFRWKGSHMYYYPEQMAWYAIGAGICGPLPEKEIEWPDCYCVVVESSEPYDVVTYHLSPLLLDRAHARVNEWLDTWKQCTAVNFWPGRSLDVLDWDAELDTGLDDD